jgi:hypothetical protein
LDLRIRPLSCWQATPIGSSELNVGNKVPDFFSPAGLVWHLLLFFKSEVRMTYIDEATRIDLTRKMENSKPFVLRSILVVLSLLIFVCVFLRIMNYEIRKDEQLYVPPARLLDQYSLYQDFFYNHPPGSAWLFYAINKLVGSDHLLLSGRLGVFAAWVFLAAAIGGVSYALTRSGLVSWCIVVLALANDVFLTQTGVTATNNLLPLPFSFLGLSLFVLAVKDPSPKPFLTALAGLFLSLAVGFKLSAVAFIPPVAIAAFLLPRACDVKKRLLYVVAPLAAGGLIGGIPVLFPLLSDPSRFLAHVVGYHTGPHLQYWRMPGVGGDDAVMSLAGKLLLARDIWFAAAVAVGLSAVMTLVLTAFQSSADERTSKLPTMTGLLMVVLGAFACSAALGFIPTPSFPQYFAPPLICLPLVLTLLFGRLSSEAQLRVRPALLAATIVVLAIEAPRFGQYLGTAVHPGRWTVTRAHDAGVVIAQRIAAAGASGKVATISPIYPLEGGLEVYPELATGPFAYRTADITEPALAAFYRMTSPSKIGALFDNDPPAALLLGFDEVLEMPMLAYARRNGYVPSTDLGFKDRYGVPILYLRPSQARLPAAS